MPDHTYNQSKQHWITRFDKPLPGGGFAQELVVTDKWLYNEKRTLEMEQEVFNKFKNDFSDQISNNPNARHITWDFIAGDGNSKIGRNTLDPEYEAVRGVTGILQEYNSYNESLPGNSSEEKIEILSGWLLAHGLGTIPHYNESNARDNRKNNLKNIQVPNEDHLILDTELF